MLLFLEACVLATEQDFARPLLEWTLSGVCEVFVTRPTRGRRTGGEGRSAHPLCQVLGPEMRVALQHLHGLMTGDGGGLQGAEAVLLEEP